MSTTPGQNLAGYPLNFGAGSNQITTESTTAAGIYYPVFTAVDGGTAPANSNISLTYDPSTGTLSAPIFNGTFSGSITNAANVAVTNNLASSATWYPTFVSASSGNLPITVASTKLSFTPSTGVLAATAFSGSGAGLTSIPNTALTNSAITIGTTAIALGATSLTLAGLTSVTSTTFIGALTGTATNATNTTITDNVVSSATWYPTFVSAATGDLPQTIASTKLSFVPSTGTLTATAFTGNGSGLTNLQSSALNNNSIIIGATTVVLGATSLTLSGLTSVSSTSFVGALTGNASTATAVNVTDNVVSSATWYPVFVSTTTGNLPITTSSTKLNFAPSTGTLSAIVFSGSGAGLTNIPNSGLVNTSVTIGTTSIALGATSTTLVGLTSVTSTSFTGTLTGSATSSGTTAITDENASASSWYPTFVAAQNGNQAQTVASTKFRFVPSTGTLTATSFSGSGATLTSIPNTALVNSAVTIGTTAIALGAASTTLAGLTSVTSTTFVGALTGNATTATTATDATNATNVEVTNNIATASAFFPTFVSANTGNRPITVASTKLTFVPSTGVLTTTAFAGNGAALTNIPNSALVNSAVTIGSTTIALGTASSTLAGLSTVTATTFIGDLNGTADKANTLSVFNDTGFTGVWFPTFVKKTYGYEPMYTSSSLLTFEPETGVFFARIFSGRGDFLINVPNSALINSSITLGSTLINLGGTVSTLSNLSSVTSTSFIGELTGNASSSTYTMNIAITNNTTSSSTWYPTIVSATSGTAPATVASTKLSFVPSTGTLTATAFTGNGSGLTNISAGAITGATITIGTTTISLSGTSLTLAGLTSVTSTSFIGALTGNASTATAANITNNNASAATWYPVFVSASIGNLPLTVASTQLSFVPSTGTLTTTTFVGALSGNAATTTAIGITNNVASSATWYPTFVSTNTGNAPATVASTKLSFVPSTGTLTSTTFVGAFTGNLTGNADTATQVYVSDVGAIASLAYICLVDSYDTNTDIRVNASDLTFDLNTGILAAPVFSGSGASLTNIPNAALTNTTVTIGTTTIALGGTSVTLAGLSSVTSTTFVGALTGTATNATNTTITDNTVSSATWYPTFVSAATGNLPQTVASTKLRFTPSTGVLAATAFSGSGAGLTSIPNSALTNSSITIGSTAIALGATSLTLAGLTSVTSTAFIGALTGTATNATNTTITDNNSSAVVWFPTFVSSNSGNLSQTVASTKLSFTPSTGTLAATVFSGSGASLTSIPNAALTNSSITIGNTSISLGATSLTLAGLTSVTSTTFVGTLTGTATNATNTTITDNTVSSATWYPTFVSASSGNLPQTVASTKLSFVPSTGTLTATRFSGDGSGLTNIPNSAFANSSITIGTTTITLGTTALALAGVTVLYTDAVQSNAGDLVLNAAGSNIDFSARNIINASAIKGTSVVTPLISTVSTDLVFSPFTGVVNFSASNLSNCGVVTATQVTTSTLTATGDLLINPSGSFIDINNKTIIDVLAIRGVNSGGQYANINLDYGTLTTSIDLRPGAITNVILNSLIVGDNTVRYSVSADGRVTVGGGGVGGADLRYYRSADNTLTVDNNAGGAAILASVGGTLSGWNTYTGSSSVFIGTVGANASITLTASGTGNIVMGGAIGSVQINRPITTSVGDLTLTPAGTNVAFSNKNITGAATVGISAASNTAGAVLTIGNATDTSTATPNIFDMGAGYYNSTSTNLAALKWRLYNNGTTFMGLGITPAQFNYVVNNGAAAWSHVFYVDTTERMRVSATGVTATALISNSLTPSSGGVLTIAPNVGTANGRFLITDGTTGSNIALQTLGAPNSGFQAINFNGDFDGTSRRYNTSKNRWRIVCDQTGANDFLSIDSYNGTTVQTAMSITRTATNFYSYNMLTNFITNAVFAGFFSSAFSSDGSGATGPNVVTSYTSTYGTRTIPANALNRAGSGFVIKGLTVLTVTNPGQTGTFYLRITGTSDIPIVTTTGSATSTGMWEFRFTIYTLISPTTASAAVSSYHTAGTPVVQNGVIGNFDTTAAINVDLVWAFSTPNVSNVFQTYNYVIQLF